MAPDAIELLRKAASRLGGPEATAEVDGLIKRLDRYSNIPGSIKGVAKLDFSQAVCDAALQTVRDLQGRGSDGLQQLIDDALFEGWAIIALAARAEPAVVDDVEAAVQGEYVPKRARDVRRATEQALARRAEAGSGGPKKPAATPDNVPQSVGKVKA